MTRKKLFSNACNELRKDLQKKPVITLTESDYEDAEDVFSVGNKTKKQKTVRKKDEWADLLSLVEDDQVDLKASASLENDLDSTEMSAKDQTMLTSTTLNGTLANHTVLNNTGCVVADKDEQLFNELFGELDQKRRLSAVKVKPDQTQSNQFKNTKPGRPKSKRNATNAENLFDRLHELEFKHLCSETGAISGLEIINTNDDKRPNDESKEIEITSIDDNQLELIVKIKYLASIHRLKMKLNERFCDRFDEIGQLLKVPEPHKLRFFAHSQPFSADQTPQALNLTVCDFVECVLSNSFNKQPQQPDSTSSSNNEATNKPAMEDPDMLELKLRDSKAHKKQQITLIKLNKFEPFSSLFKEYAELKQIDLKQLRFEFDGEVLEDDQTPTDLDMEDESLIDVIVRQ